MNPASKAIDTFVHALKPSLRDQGLLVAVSGGSDSLSLLLLLAECRDRLGFPLSAVTIDHALRTEARAEAKFVADVCLKKGIPHDIIRVEWTQGQSHSQAAAREHRYKLLANEARRQGKRIILTGHTLDDQYETFLLRIRAGSHWWGLAGMDDIAPLPVWPEGHEIGLARPLLRTRRLKLRDYLSEQKQPWIDDPSNENTVFERVRFRQFLRGSVDESHRIQRIMSPLSRLRTELGHVILSRSDAAMEWQNGGAVTVKRHAFLCSGSEVKQRWLQALLPCVSGSTAPPKLSLISDLIRKFGSAETGVLTLGGCRIEWNGGKLIMTPELLGDGGTSEARDAETIWAGRVKFSRNLGGSERLSFWADHTVPDHLRDMGLPSYQLRKHLPVLLDSGGQVKCVPHLENTKIVPQDLAPARFRRWFDAKTEIFTEESRLRESFSQN